MVLTHGRKGGSKYGETNTSTEYLLRRRLSLTSIMLNGNFHKIRLLHGQLTTVTLGKSEKHGKWEQRDWGGNITRIQ